MRPEPRAMTTADAVVLTLGAALSLVSLPSWLAVAASYPWTGVGMFLRNSAGFWVGTVGLGAVTLGRTFLHRRLPRPAEWLALGAFAWGLTLVLAPTAHEELVGLVARPLAIFGGGDAAARWTTAGLVAGMVAAGLIVADLGRGLLPPWLRTVWLMFLIFLAIWSPLAVFDDHAANWFAPAGGFGQGDLMVLYWGICRWFAATPLAVLVGLPVVATVAERLRGRAWSWVEWSAAATAGLAGLLASVVFRGEFRHISFGWAAERAIAAGWVVIVAQIDLTILRRLDRRAARDRDLAADRTFGAEPSPIAAPASRRG